MTEAAAPVTSSDELVQFVRSGEKPPSEWAIGTEHEKIGVYESTGERVPYEGEHGIGALLTRIAERDVWKPIYEDENVIALEKSGASITLEPGGQIELSGAPLGSLRETCREFNAHVDLLKDVGADFGIAWLALGIDPLHAVSEIPQMPKHRYEIMRSYLPDHGELALEMMFASATVQANFDFGSEADMVSKLRMAMGCTAIVSALFANSSISGGRPNGFITRRVEIWRHTDPDRCGLLPFVFEPGFGYQSYVDWAIDVPMFFIVRDGRYIPARGTSFRQFMQHGLAGHQPSLDDWNLHLTTLFPEVRLKKIIEVRGADAVPPDLICALPALWKGLLYDASACEAAWRLVKGFSWNERLAAQPAVARQGLAALIAGRPALELAGELVEISSQGLQRIAEREGGVDERSFLEPLRAQLELGKSPGEIVLERWRGEWGGSSQRLIEYARY